MSRSSSSWYFREQRWVAKCQKGFAFFVIFTGSEAYVYCYLRLSLAFGTVNIRPHDS